MEEKRGAQDAPPPDVIHVQTGTWKLEMWRTYRRPNTSAGLNQYSRQKLSLFHCSHAKFLHEIRFHPPLISVCLVSLYFSVLVIQKITWYMYTYMNCVCVVVRCSWTDQAVLSDGLCRYGNSVECCWGWRQMDWGRCQREDTQTQTSSDTNQNKSFPCFRFGYNEV